MQRTLALALVLAFAAFGCDSTSGPSGPAGTLNLRLTDSPFTDADAVLVTFTGVRAHRAESDWETLPFADAAAVSRTCDLKKLQNGAEDILGTGPLVAGQYTMIRLVVESAKLYFDNPTAAGPACATTITPPAGASADVTVSSGEVKLNRPFTLTADTATTILLDLDGNGSIHQQGNGSYRMTPVIGIVSVTAQTPPPAQP